MITQKQMKQLKRNAETQRVLYTLLVYTITKFYEINPISYVLVISQIYIRKSYIGNYLLKL